MARMPAKKPPWTDTVLILYEFGYGRVIVQDPMLPHRHDAPQLPKRRLHSCASRGLRTLHILPPRHPSLQ